MKERTEVTQPPGPAPQPTVFFSGASWPNWVTSAIQYIIERLNDMSDSITNLTAAVNSYVTAVGTYAAAVDAEFTKLEQELSAAGTLTPEQQQAIADAQANLAAAQQALTEEQAKIPTN